MRIERALAVIATGILFAVGSAATADPVKYQTPPAPIAEILRAPPTPSVSLSRDDRTLAIFGREGLPTVAAMASPTLRIGGHRINPRNNGQSEGRSAWLNSLSFEDLATGKMVAVDLPKGARFAYPRWSPDGKTLALVMDTDHGLELWLAAPGAKAAPAPGLAALNATFGTPYQWLPDSSGVLALAIPAARGAPPADPAAPEGPIVQESLGRSAPARTYEDLLQNSHDEALFDYYFTGQLTVARFQPGGASGAVGKPGLIEGFSVSPDGRYLLVTQLQRPFSYLVPSALFPTEIAVWSIDGKPVWQLADRPLADNLPIDFDAVPTGPRDVEWRADAPATLVWAEAQDGGDPKKKVAVHDRLLMRSAPFDAPPVTLADLPDRYARIDWGRGDFALVTGRWFKTRHERRLAVEPDHPGQGRVLLERNYQDQYADPGRPVKTTDARGQEVMQFTPDHKAVFLAGDGASKEGEHPTLSRMALADGKVQLLWQGEDPHYESVVTLLGDTGTRLLTRRESRDEPPNYFVRDLHKKEPRQVTAFKDPAPQFAGVTKQLVSYQRADGVKLSGTLYLPAGYDPKRDGPLPMLMWAYPTEFTDASVAGQVVDRARNRFTRPGGISHLLMVTQGYAVFDGPSMPIIGANGAEPNDSYVEQLVADARAAVDKVVEMGVADRDRIAIGGHSYGAFMTANLLAHSDLFRAGIARSGAYNRTLTPFGFQSEQRNYWQATEVYTAMSPFTYADRIKTPILLIHGEADDNSGTFPIQSERFYAALKGNGAIVRYVVLPFEPHGYRGLESSDQSQWEMVNWLDRWVKHAKPRKPAAPAG